MNTSTGGTAPDGRAKDARATDWPADGADGVPDVLASAAVAPLTTLTPLHAALVAEACSKSGVLWVRPVGAVRHSMAWHVWHEDAAYVVQGVNEQVLPLLSGQVEVTVPGKETRGRVVTFVAQADILPARSPEWEDAAKALSAARLNARDGGEAQRDRWASGTLITRLTPLYVGAAGAGDDRSESGAVPAPVEGPTTVTAHHPWHLRGRAAAWRARRASRRP